MAEYQAQLTEYGVNVRREDLFDEVRRGDDVGGLQALYYTYAHLQVPSQGALSARLSVTLPGNAVVRDFKVKLTARRADEAVAGAVAQLRMDQSAEIGKELIVDFGRVRTVSSVSFRADARIERVDQWTGTEFNRSSYSSAFHDPSTTRANANVARFRSDVRTERLRISLVSTVNVGTLLDDLRLVLPDAPKDLAITLNGGAPVWSLPGPTAKGVDAALDTRTWNSAHERLVDLTDVLAGLTGDPLSPAPRTFELVLTSQEAGVLEIAQHALDYDIIRRAQFGSGASTTLDFAAEGVTDVPLVPPGTPGGARAQEIRFTASGAFGPERRSPATGPVATPVSSVDPAPLITLEMTPDRALIFQLGAEAGGLSDIRGLRLPLRSGAEGAELRLLPWSNAGPGRMQPAAALEDLTGDPVTLDPGGAEPVWTSLPFAGPLALEPDNLPWVALLVARGSVGVDLSEAAQGQMRLGPPSGPWRQMPALFGAARFSGLRFPYRVLGDAVDETGPAPLSLGLAGGAGPSIALDPTPAGTALVLDAGNRAAPVLRITHTGIGALTLDRVDIIYDS